MTSTPDGLSPIPDRPWCTVDLPVQPRDLPQLRAWVRSRAGLADAHVRQISPAEDLERYVTAWGCRTGWLRVFAVLWWAAEFIDAARDLTESRDWASRCLAGTYVTELDRLKLAAEVEAYDEALETIAAAEVPW